MSNRLEDDLRASVHAGDVVVVAGAGVSIAATLDDRASWRGLLSDGVERVTDLNPGLGSDWSDRLRAQISSGDMDDLLGAAEQITAKLGAPTNGEWSRWLRDSAGNLTINDPSVPNAVAALGVPVLTTNYDGILDASVGGHPITWRDPRRFQRIIRGDDRAVGHLHGYWDEPESVVLGIRSYEQILGAVGAQALQQAVAVAKTLVFVGVGEGLADPNWSALLAFMQTALSGSEYRHYLLCLNGERTQLAKTHQQGSIVPIGYGDKHEDLASFLRTLAPEGRTTASSSFAPSEPHSSGIVRTAIGLIIEDDQVVIVQRRQREGELDWQFPAGFVNPYSDARDQLCNEILQETGLRVRITQFLGERIHPGTQINCVYYRAKVLSGTLMNGDPSENLAVEWVGVDRVYDYIDESRIFPPVRLELDTSGKG